MAYERITIDPDRMSGLPCIRDTRVTVSAVLGQLAAGRDFAEVLADYPYLERAAFGRFGVRRRGRTGTRTAAGPASVGAMRLLIDANLSPRVQPSWLTWDLTSFTLPTWAS